MKNKIYYYTFVNKKLFKHEIDKTYKQCNIVYDGKSLYLMENNDQLAKDIFIKHKKNKIKKLKDELIKEKELLKILEGSK